MPKTDDTENLEIKQLLVQLNQKIGSAKVLNGGFDRLEAEVASIKNMQAKLNVDFESHKVNDSRIEQKLDRLYDPEDGIYAKMQKSEIMMTSLTQKVDALSDVDKTIKVRLETVEKKTDDTDGKMKNLSKITGEDNKELEKSIKLSKGAWWFAGFVVTGLLSALGKFLWDLFVG